MELSRLYNIVVQYLYLDSIKEPCSVFMNTNKIFYWANIYWPKYFRLVATLHTEIFTTQGYIKSTEISETTISRNPEPQ